MRESNPYRRALAVPGALRFSAAGFLGRLQISMFGLGTVLLISSLSGRSAAGIAVAAATCLAGTLLFAAQRAPPHPAPGGPLQARPGRLTEAMAWLTSALAVGTAAGSAAAGQVIDAGGARGGYAFAAACGAGAALACLAGLTWLSEPSPQPSPAVSADAPP